MLIRATLQIHKRGVTANVKAVALGISLPEGHAFLRWSGEPRLLVGLRHREWALFTHEFFEKPPRIKQRLDLIMGDLLDKCIAVHSIRASSEVGTSDAALTSLCAGLLWAGFSPIIALCARLGIEPDVRVLPDFHQKAFSLRLSCMFTLRLGQLMLTLLRAWRRRVKHGSSH